MQWTRLVQRALQSANGGLARGQAGSRGRKPMTVTYVDLARHYAVWFRAGYSARVDSSVLAELEPRQAELLELVRDHGPGLLG